MPNQNSEARSQLERGLEGMTFSEHTCLNRYSLACQAANRRRFAPPRSSVGWDSPGAQTLATAIMVVPHSSTVLSFQALPRLIYAVVRHHLFPS